MPVYFSSTCRSTRISSRRPEGQGSYPKPAARYTPHEPHGLAEGGGVGLGWVLELGSYKTQSQVCCPCLFQVDCQAWKCMRIRLSESQGNTVLQNTGLEPNGPQLKMHTIAQRATRHRSVGGGGLRGLGCHKTKITPCLKTY